MTDNDQQPLHEVVRALLGLRTVLHGHTGAWWALGQELDARYGRQEVEAEFKRQLDVRHGSVEDIKRPAKTKPTPRTGHVIPEAGPLPASRLVKPKPPRGRIQKESEPPPEAGAQMCHACNGTGEVQGEIQGGPPGPMACTACNGKGTVAQ